MPKLFSKWCDCEIEEDGNKQLIRYVECEGGRNAVLAKLPERIRDHYIGQIELSSILAELDFHETAEVIKELYPTSLAIKSGDLGEILAVESCEEELGFRIPIRRFRYKDHRNMSMRGDDLIGVEIDDDRLSLLKGEAKSRQNLGTATIEDARAALNGESGRPSAHALIFVGRILIRNGDASDKVLGAALLREAKSRAVPKRRISHVLFTLSGTPAWNPLQTDFENADGERPQYIVNVRIPDHSAFITTMFEEAGKLGDD